MKLPARILAFITLAIVLALAATSCSTGKTNARNSANNRPGKHTVKPESEKELYNRYVKDAHLQGDRKKIIAEAITWLGTPYKYACQEKDAATDCSGFVMQVYLTQLDLSLPRNSARQAEFCKSIKPEKLKPGDLVFFATGKTPGKVTHVGIMLDSVSFIHASSSKGVVVSRMDNPWYATRLIKFGRHPDMSSR